MSENKCICCGDSVVIDKDYSGKIEWKVGRKDSSDFVTVRSQTKIKATYLAAKHFGLDWRKEEDRNLMYAIPMKGR